LIARRRPLDIFWEVTVAASRRNSGVRIYSPSDSRFIATTATADRLFPFPDERWGRAARPQAPTPGLRGHNGAVGYDQRLGQGAWKNLRRFILDRDRWLCQIRGPKCTGGATCVDHIVSRVDGGDFYNPQNLRAACRACNAAGGAKLTNRKRWRAPPPPVEAPAGPEPVFRIF